MNELIVNVATLHVPAFVASTGGPAQVRFLEFFAATIRNPNTRRSYWRAATDFLAYCEQLGVSSIDQVMPLHVAAWVETLCQYVPPLIFKLRHAATEWHLLDWLVACQVIR